MLRFFKHSGPIQLLGLFLIILVLKLPLLIFDSPLLIEELYHKVLTEKLLSGSFLYKDVIDSTAPLSSLSYFVIGLIFNNEIITFRIFSVFILFIQALIFRNILNNNQILSEKGDIPSLIFVLVHCIIPDFFSLSPAFLANTFILISMGRTFKHLKSEHTDNEIFFTGFYIGIAYLFCSVAIIFFALAIFSFLIFTRTKLRFYFILVLGLSFPVFSMFSYYFIFDANDNFLSYFLFNFRNNYFENIDYQSIMIYFLFTLILVILGILMAFNHNRYINYQVVCLQNMLIWFVISALVLFYLYHTSSTNFIFLIPPIAFFITQFLILIKNIKIKTFVFTFYVLTLLITSFIQLFELETDVFSHQFCNQYVTGNKWNIISENKKIAYFGSDINIFTDNTSTLPFLNKNLSQEYLSNLDSYSKIIFISESFEKNMPEFIIDEWGVMPKIFEKIPRLAKHYVKSKHFNLYERIGK